MDGESLTQKHIQIIASAEVNPNIDEQEATLVSKPISKLVIWTCFGFRDVW